MTAIININGNQVIYNDGEITCKDEFLKQIIVDTLKIQPSSSPSNGFLPQIFELFKGAELVQVIEDEEVYY